MIDTLWIAASAVDYWLSERPPCGEILAEFWIDRHPCDDEPYVANVSVQEMRHIDGTEGGTL